MAESFAAEAERLGEQVVHVDLATTQYVLLPASVSIPDVLEWFATGGRGRKFNVRYRFGWASKAGLTSPVRPGRRPSSLNRNEPADGSDGRPDDGYIVWEPSHRSRGHRSDYAPDGTTARLVVLRSIRALRESYRP